MATATPPPPPPADDADRFSLIELDLPVTPAPAPAPVAAPAVTLAPPVAPSPLVQGRALLTGASTPEGLKQAAHTVTDVCVAAGIVDKTHPTREALRALYVATLAWFATKALRAAWLSLWVDLARAVEIRPSLVRAAITTVAAPEAPPTGLDLAQTLTGIASEGAANAAGHGAGSMRGGQLAGVGYTNAAGYVTALANGVKRATADGYLSTLRSQYHYTDAAIAALTVTILTDSDLPVGPGILHTPTGPDIWEQRKAARAAAAAELRATADAATVAFAQRLTVSEADPSAWWEIGWRGEGSITRAELIAACGRAPEPKANTTQLARVIDGMRGTHDAAMVTAALPNGVQRRWQIGRGAQHQAYIGGEYGKVLALIDLGRDGKLSWDGDTAICAEVRAEYERVTGDEVLRAGDVTSWLSQVLRYEYGAIASGHDYLVAPKNRDAARALVAKIAAVWSTRNWKAGQLGKDGNVTLGRLYTDVASVLGQVYTSLADEIAEAEEQWAVTVAAADKRGEKVGARAAATALLRIDGDKPTEGLTARIDEFRCLGAGPLASFRARAAALRVKVRAAVEAANDGAVVRGLLLELK